MPPSIWRSFILNGLLFSNFATALSDNPFPTRLELDLVFPRNETYKSTYPFPIVFAVQGARAAWPLGFDINWVVSPVVDPKIYDTKQGPLLEPSHLLIDLPDRDNGTLFTGGEVLGGEDPFIYITSSESLQNWTQITSKFFLSWRLKVKNCTGDETLYIETKRPPRYDTGGFIVFSIDNDLGLAPTFTPQLHKCPANSSTLSILRGAMEYVDRFDKEPCMVLDNANLEPEPTPCALSLKSDLPSRVTASMLETARCNNGTWPDPSLVTRCNHPIIITSEPKPTSTSAAREHRAGGAVVLGAVLSGLVASWITTF